MDYIIFGAGVTGIRAKNFLGPLRVLCFVDNNRAGEEIHGKKVVSFVEMLELYKEKECVVVIASEKYWEEMEAQVLASGIITRYFVFHERDVWEINSVLPQYFLYRSQVFVSYAQAISNYRVSQYKKIAIYGENRFLHYLICELMIQSPQAEITVIPIGEEPYNSLGCEKRTLESCKEEIDCLLLNVEYCDDPIRGVLEDGEFHFDVLDLWETERFVPAFQYKELEKYKDLHKGQRVFLVCNGPSLRVEDLDKLHEHGELCIGLNKIFKIYDKTKWRADYLAMVDQYVIEDSKEFISKSKEKIFIGDTILHCYMPRVNLPEVQYFHYRENRFYPNYASFSTDFTKGFYRGVSVTYGFGLQFAAYIGCKEIYLIGCDHNFEGVTTNPENHFIKDYFSENVVELHNICYKKDEATKAYETAERFAKKNGIKIYNATRGGKLEVFERVDFDSIFD